MADGGAVQLRVDGELMRSEQLDLDDKEDAVWLQGAEAGRVLVISGDNSCSPIPAWSWLPLRA